MSTTDNQGPLWEVFTQKKPGQPFRHSGSVHAYDKNMAIEAARDLFTRRNEGTALWVVKSEEIISISINDDASFFEPADDKIYRHPTFYEMPEGLEHM